MKETVQPPHPLPSYQSSRQDEEWSPLSDPALRFDFLDKLKYLPLRNGDGWYLSLGGDIRERYELVDHPGWGQGPTDTSGYLVQRYMLHADIHLGPAVRFFTQLQSGTVNGRNGGPRPTDQDKLDVHQAFADIEVEKPHSLTFRLGRQELSFGTFRLVSIREDPNIRSAFDGVRTSFNLGGWRIDGWAVKPVETNKGYFDDSPDHTRTFWGAYAVRPWKMLPVGHVDLYYMGIDRKTAQFNQGTARETRHSVGTRLWGGLAAWDYNYEMLCQWGTFGHGNIRAWTAASDDGYTLRHVRFGPRLGLKADVTSGDRNPSDPNLQTFDAMFPKGAYFGQIALIGPSNHIDLQPSLDFRLAKNWTMKLESGSFWRQTIHDGIYAPSLNLLRSAGSSQSRYVGSQAALEVHYQVNRHLTWVGNYTRFFTGQFLADTGPAKDVNYCTTWIAFRF